MGRMKDLLLDMEQLTVEQRQEKLTELGLMDVDSETPTSSKTLKTLMVVE